MRSAWIGLLIGLTLPALAQAGEKEDFIRDLKQRIAKLDTEIQRLEVPAVNDRVHEIDRLWTLAHKLNERARQRYYLAAELGAEADARPWEDAGHRADLQASIEAAGALMKLKPDGPPLAEVELFMAQIHRQLSDFSDMYHTLERLIAAHSTSPQATQALMLLGDYRFDRSETVEAGKYYQRVIAQPGDLCDGMARYKLGWVHINEARWLEAAAQFEAVARGPEESTCVDPLYHTTAKLELVEEALFALVFCYTHVHPPGHALAYFERYQMPKQRAVRVYEKLANRLFIIEQFPAARMVYRHLLTLSDDPERVPDWKQRLADIEQLAPAK